ncbi:MAG: hypothetical protein U0822_15365 [Anaerolineae bacterium]
MSVTSPAARDSLSSSPVTVTAEPAASPGKRVDAATAPCIAESGVEIFARVSKTNSFRRVLRFPFRKRWFVAKFHSRLIGQVVWHDLVAAKRASDAAARYLPVAPTLFVYAHNDRDQPSIIRIQHFVRRRLADVTDEEVQSPDMVAQQIAIIDGAKRMVEAEGWLPDPFGFPATAWDALHWPSLRRSTNIMEDEEGRLVFIDINSPRPWKRQSNPLGRLALWMTDRVLARYRAILDGSQHAQIGHACDGRTQYRP